MYIQLKPNDSRHLYIQLYDAIRSEILAGRAKSHEPLPSKRTLKNHLNVSMTTVERAYQQLIDEDFIYSIEKKGFFVSEMDALPTKSHPVSMINKPIVKSSNLSLGDIETSNIQSDVIRKIANQVFSKHELLNPGQKSGEPELKQAVKQYLKDNRGVDCVEDQIFIGPSTEMLLEQLFVLLDFRTITIEEPGYPVVKQVCKRLNVPYEIAHLDSEGMLIPGHNHKVIHVTPSHQFPTGVVMSLNRRIQHINDARENNRYIIEDDYDSEYRYEGKPLPALHSLEHSNHTIYMTTFSKSIYPSLRLAIMVLPKTLAEKYYNMDLSCNVSRQMQHIISKFISEGYLERHLNRTRKIYRKKMHAITDWLSNHFPQVEISGHHTGMHFIIRVPHEDITKVAEQHGLISLNTYAHKNDYSDQVVIGIGKEDISHIQEILKHFLNECLRQ